MLSKPIDELLIDFLRDEGVDERAVDYIEYALDYVITCEAVKRSIEDGSIVVDDDGIRCGEVTIH